MRSLPYALPALSLFLPRAVVGSPELSLDCASHDGRTNDECKRPMQAVTTVTPGAYYIAKIACPDCAVPEFSGERENRTYSLVQKENDLFFNISLTRDHRTLLLNGQPIFPSLSTNPHPPYISTPQIAPNFTRSDLADTLACARKCRDESHGCACIESVISTAELDFDYYSKWLDSHPETQTEKWEVTLDAIGGSNGPDKDAGRVFGSDDQSVLRIIMQGKEIQKDRPGSHKQAGSPLSGGYQEPETVYDYEIASIEFSQRYAEVPRVEKLGLWDKLRRFFGSDVVRGDGHVVYLAEEWGGYGKKGSLRQGFGIVVHEWRWDIVFTIVGVVALGLAAAWFSWWLFFAVKRQRELARWDGMDQVWARMRRDGGDEEDAQLLAAGYRDENAYRDRESADEGYRDEPGDSPPSYSDEIQTNKPLPSKPLPEKPLPAVPLIES
ncbi:hypothetical protein DPSP01_007849 [Paraphaeosphaeria sporulosa]|uniref:Uncharacterized protein n=1 Tax=Paraphaeosphaeria sporulosa TaxID=1460663 RepID=A0A177CK36_9PLEO|nr:uncharacterized protein CC84DRAFT_1216307 [Paraphaeosphaeria sporulosa]OAG07332.1 hypothetical protein CC84DRAFT_1216307 [Paraphaeosphaeria sporulosa]